MDLPDAIWTIVTRSRGRIFCRKQTFKAGFGDANLDRWLKAGLIQRLAPGWYRITGDLVPVDQLLWLAHAYLLLSSGPTPIFSGASALGKYGVPGFSMMTPPTILVDLGDRIRIRTVPFNVLHTDVSRVVTRSINGLQLATAARALADLVRERVAISQADLIDAVDRTRNHLRLGVPELMDEWATMLRHPGAQQLLALTHSGVFDVESGGERSALHKVFSLCAAPPDCQVTVLGDFRADFAYLFANLIIEYYGEPHDRSANKDATRMLALEMARFLVIVLTRSMLEDPLTTAQHIDETRRRRELQVIEGSLERAALPVQPRRRVPLRTLTPIG